MSFNELTIKKLRDAAVELGAVLDPDQAKTMKKDELLAALTEDGVSFADYERLMDLKEKVKAAEEAEKGDDAPIQSTAEPVKFDPQQSLGETLLIKMERDNFSFDVPAKNGKSRWHFSKEHPFQAMPRSEASFLLDTFTGFRIASPTEASEYYG